MKETERIEIYKGRKEHERKYDETIRRHTER
jgi:hypothetical protein